MSSSPQTVAQRCQRLNAFLDKALQEVQEESGTSKEFNNRVCEAAIEWMKLHNRVENIDKVDLADRNRVEASGVKLRQALEVLLPTQEDPKKLKSYPVLWLACSVLGFRQSTLPIPKSLSFKAAFKGDVLPILIHSSHTLGLSTLRLPVLLKKQPGQLKGQDVKLLAWALKEPSLSYARTDVLNRLDRELEHCHGVQERESLLKLMSPCLEGLVLGGLTERSLQLARSLLEQHPDCPFPNLSPEQKSLLIDCALQRLCAPSSYRPELGDDWENVLYLAFASGVDLPQLRESLSRSIAFQLMEAWEPYEHFPGGGSSTENSERAMRAFRKHYHGMTASILQCIYAQEEKKLKAAGQLVKHMSVHIGHEVWQEKIMPTLLEDCPLIAQLCLKRPNDPRFHMIWRAFLDFPAKDLSAASRQILMHCLPKEEWEIYAHMHVDALMDFEPIPGDRAEALGNIALEWLSLGAHLVQEGTQLHKDIKALGGQKALDEKRLAALLAQKRLWQRRFMQLDQDCPSWVKADWAEFWTRDGPYLELDEAFQEVIEEYMPVTVDSFGFEASGVIERALAQAYPPPLPDLSEKNPNVFWGQFVSNLDKADFRSVRYRSSDGDFGPEWDQHPRPVLRSDALNESLEKVDPQAFVKAMDEGALHKYLQALPKKELFAQQAAAAFRKGKISAQAMVSALLLWEFAVDHPDFIDRIEAVEPSSAKYGKIMKRHFASPGKTTLPEEFLKGVSELPTSERVIYRVKEMGQSDDLFHLEDRLTEVTPGFKFFSQGELIIPTFGMLQTYMQSCFGADAVMPLPVLGGSSMQDIYERDFLGQHDFGMGFPGVPFPAYPDGLAGGIAGFGYSMHDVYHMIKASMIPVRDRQRLQGCEELVKSWQKQLLSQRFGTEQQLTEIDEKMEWLKLWMWTLADREWIGAGWNGEAFIKHVVNYPAQSGNSAQEIATDPDKEARYRRFVKELHPQLLHCYQNT